VGNLLSDANIRLHDPAEVVSDPDPNDVPSYASRSATKKSRTKRLRGLLRHRPYFHNGIPATLDAIVEVYDARKGPYLPRSRRPIWWSVWSRANANPRSIARRGRNHCPSPDPAGGEFRLRGYSGLLLKMMAK
jgi:hypothetical protein